MAILGNDGFFADLVKQGVVPPETRHVLIKVSYDDVVRVYYEANADKRMCNVEFAELLKGVKAVQVEAAD
jgi:hypothetical protein